MEKTTKKTTLTGKEWWLHLMYWDPDKVDQANLCDTWKIPFVTAFKAFVLCLCVVLYVIVHSFCICLFWSRPNLGTTDGYLSLPFDRLFGVRWGNFLLPLYIIFLGSFGIHANSGGWVMAVSVGALTLSGVIVVFGVIDEVTDLGQFSTLPNGSLIVCLSRKCKIALQGVTSAFKKKKNETSVKTKGDNIGLFKVLKLRLKSLREKVCYSIPIVRD